jgi:hypothetical protein
VLGHVLGKTSDVGRARRTVAPRGFSYIGRKRATIWIISPTATRQVEHHAHMDTIKALAQHTLGLLHTCMGHSTDMAHWRV